MKPQNGVYVGHRSNMKCPRLLVKSAQGILWCVKNEKRHTPQHMQHSDKKKCCLELFDNENTGEKIWGGNLRNLNTQPTDRVGVSGCNEWKNKNHPNYQIAVPR